MLWLIMTSNADRKDRSQTTHVDSAVGARYVRFASDARSSSKGIARHRTQDRRDGNGASHRGMASVLAKPFQASPSFCFKVTMSGSNALRPLTLFWE